MTDSRQAPPAVLAPPPGARNNGGLWDESGCEVRAFGTFKAPQHPKNLPTAPTLGVQKARTSYPLGAGETKVSGLGFLASPTRCKTANLSIFRPNPISYHP